MNILLFLLFFTSIISIVNQINISKQNNEAINIDTFEFANMMINSTNFNELTQKKAELY